MAGTASAAGLSGPSQTPIVVVQASDLFDMPGCAKRPKKVGSWTYLPLLQLGLPLMLLMFHACLSILDVNCHHLVKDSRVSAFRDSVRGVKTAFPLTTLNASDLYDSFLQGLLTGMPAP